MIRYLSEQDLDMSRKDRNGVNALLLACTEGHVPILEALIERGAKLNDRDKDGRAPLHAAIEQNSTNSLPMVRRTDKVP